MYFIAAVIIVVISTIFYFGLKKAGKTREAKYSIVAAVTAAFLALITAFTFVPAGTIGVVDIFGMVSDNTLKAGVNVVNPMAGVIKFSIKTQEIKETMNVPSKEGLSVQL